MLYRINETNAQQKVVAFDSDKMTLQFYNLQNFWKIVDHLENHERPLDILIVEH